MEFDQTIEVNNHRLAATMLDAGGKDIVIFCHGYRSSSIGPNRLFVTCAREFAKYQISSIRFDQYGSGNSEGDFLNSSFKDWVETTESLVNMFLNMGYRVGLFGQSMGGSTVIVAGSTIPELTALVAWVPDPSIETFKAPASGIIEEGGQRVSANYWKEAHTANIPAKLKRLKSPSYIVQASSDGYVSKENHNAIINNARDNHTVEMFKGYTHSSWTFDQASEVINKSTEFIVKQFVGQANLLSASKLIAYLQKSDINPILYGSLGISFYLGNFKSFGDIDLLIDEIWLKKKWPKLIQLMEKAGFTMVDEHEHEFKNPDGLVVAFAEDFVLVRDGISELISKDTIEFDTGIALIRTLKAAAFKRAYEFSQKDGYRIKTRGKKDKDVIKLIDLYLSRVSDRKQ